MPQQIAFPKFRDSSSQFRSKQIWPKYFVGEAEFNKLERLLSEFKLSIPKRRVAISVSKVSTGNIDGEFKAQDKLLKDELDALVEPFQFSQPDFFNAYKNARNIVDYSGRGKAAPVSPIANPV